MAPRPLESREQFIARLRRAAHSAKVNVRFGASHHSHVVVVEAGRWRVRPLVTDPAKAAAFLAQHGRYMPENAEDLAEAGPLVLFDAASLDALISLLEASPRWPL